MVYLVILLVLILMSFMCMKNDIVSFKFGTTRDNNIFRLFMVMHLFLWMCLLLENVSTMLHLSRISLDLHMFTFLSVCV